MESIYKQAWKQAKAEASKLVGFPEMSRGYVSIIAISAAIAGIWFTPWQDWLGIPAPSTMDEIVTRLVPTLVLLALYPVILGIKFFAAIPKIHEESQNTIAKAATYFAQIEHSERIDSQLILFLNEALDLLENPNKLDDNERDVEAETLNLAITEFVNFNLRAAQKQMILGNRKTDYDRWWMFRHTGAETHGQLESLSQKIPGIERVIGNAEPYSQVMADGLAITLEKTKAIDAAPALQSPPSTAPKRLQ